MERDQQKFDEILRTQGQEYFKLQSQTVANLADKWEKSRDNIVGFIYKITQTIAIVAGFGFTAISVVHHRYFFILGEGLFLSAIFLGVYRASAIYEASLRAYSDLINKFDSAFEKRNNVYVEFRNKIGRAHV